MGLSHPGARMYVVEQLVDRIIEHLATEPPAIFVTPWLWALYGVMFLGAFFTDRRVHWEQRPRPRLPDFFLATALFASGVVSMATGATFPNGRSILWPLLGFALMAAGLVLRVQATGRLGRDFNGAFARARARRSSPPARIGGCATRATWG